MDLTPLFVVGAGLARSIAGWLENSLEDGKINDFEWKQLGATVVRVGLFGLVIVYFPGVEVTYIEAAAAAIGGDLVLQVVKKFKATKKK